MTQSPTFKRKHQGFEEERLFAANEYGHESSLPRPEKLPGEIITPASSISVTNMQAATSEHPLLSPRGINRLPNAGSRVGARSSRTTSNGTAIQKPASIKDGVEFLRKSKESVTTPGRGSNQKIKELENRVAELELEKLRFLSHSNTLNNEHNQQTEQLNEEIMILKAEKERMVKRLAAAARIDEAIIDLFVEMRDRSWENPDEPANIDKEKEKLRQQNPLVVLDLLRSELKTLQSFKEDYENELKGDLKRKKTATEIQNEELRRSLSEMRIVQESFHQGTEEAIEQMKLALSEKDRLEEEKKQMKEIYETDIQILEMNCKKLQAENEMLQKKLKEKEKQIEDTASQLAKTKELEETIKSMKAKYKSEILALQKQNQRELQRKQLDIDRLKLAVSEKKKLEGKLKWANDQLHGSKNHVNPTELEELQRKVEKLTKELENQREIAKKAEDHARKSKIHSDDYVKKNEELKKEIKILKMTKTVRSVEPTPDIHKLKGMEFRSFVDNNHSHLEVYQKMLSDKDKELQQVNNRLRRMMMAWNRGQLLKKSTWMEKKIVMNELEQLKMELAARKTSSGNTAIDPSGLKSWVENHSNEDLPDDEPEEIEEKAEKNEGEPIKLWEELEKYDSLSLSKKFHKLRPQTAPNGSLTTRREELKSSRPPTVSGRKTPLLLSSSHSTIQVGNLLRVS